MPHSPDMAETLDTFAMHTSFRPAFSLSLLTKQFAYSVLLYLFHLSSPFRSGGDSNRDSTLANSAMGREQTPSDPGISVFQPYLYELMLTLASYTKKPGTRA